MLELEQALVQDGVTPERPGENTVGTKPSSACVNTEKPSVPSGVEPVWGQTQEQPPLSPRHSLILQSGLIVKMFPPLL